MGWIVALVAVTTLVLLRFILSCPEAEEDWRDQAEGLRQRQERDGVPQRFIRRWSASSPQAGLK